MLKRIIALLLCAFMLIPFLASCSKKDEDDVGAYITMYLTDDVFDFDPANAYYNKDALNVVSLLFDTLFTLNEKGKVKNSLAQSYVIKENPTRGEYTMEITLNETCWSNGTLVSADDVVFAWKRLVRHTNDFAAASLLYDIKNARAVKEGDVSIDDLGVEALSVNLVREKSPEAPVEVKEEAPKTEFELEIEALIQERKDAKKAKNYARADEIRNYLKEKGVTLVDTAQGTTYTID